jgi:predicted transcriptional regulator
MTIHADRGGYLREIVVASVANHTVETAALPEVIRTGERVLVVQRDEAELPPRDQLDAAVFPSRQPCLTPRLSV